MSRSLNQVTLVGNLTRDPEMRATPSGDEVCSFSLALNYNFNSRDGQPHEGVDFVDVVAWGGLASIVSTYCHKGKQILVVGRLKSSSWEQDGQKRSKLEVVASNVILLGGAGDVSNSVKSDSSDKPTPKKSKKATTDYEIEDYEYDEQAVNPEDIPF